MQGQIKISEARRFTCGSANECPSVTFSYSKIWLVYFVSICYTSSLITVIPSAVWGIDSHRENGDEIATWPLGFGLPIVIANFTWSTLVFYLHYQENPSLLGLVDGA
jgi:hypothetical protein